MNKFTFRLDKVLTYREDSEKAAHKQLISAQTSLNRSQEQLAQLKGELTKACNTEATQGTGFDVNSMLHQARYADHLTACIQCQEKDVQEKAEDVSKERVVLEAKMKERKILSKLKEKRSEDFLYQARLAEQRQNDEFAVTGFSRR